MKAIQILLVLVLIASFNCNDFLDFVLCLIGKEEIANVITELIEKIKNKESALNFISFIFQKIPIVEAQVKECLN